MSEDSSKPTAKIIPWNPAVAVTFVVVSFFLTQVLAAVLVTLWPAINHWSDDRTSNWLDSAVTAQFLYVLIAEGLVVLAVWQFLRFYKRDWSTIGLRKPKLSDMGSALLYAPIYYLTYIVLTVVASALIPSLNVDQAQQLGFDPVSAGELILTFISLVVLPPLVEEILMRGFLYGSLRSYMPKIGAALITSAIFAAAHLQFGSNAPLLWVAAIDTFVLSLFLIKLREKTGGLWAGITLHALKNGLAFALLFVFHFS